MRFGLGGVMLLPPSLRRKSEVSLSDFLLFWVTLTRLFRYNKRL